MVSSTPPPRDRYSNPGDRSIAQSENDAETPISGCVVTAPPEKSATLIEKANMQKKRIKKPGGTRKQSKKVKGKNAGAKKIIKSKGSKSQHEESDDEKPRAEPEGSKDAKSQPALVLRLEPSKGEERKQPKRRNIKKAKDVTSSKTDSRGREMLPAMESSTRPEPVDEPNAYVVSDRIGSHEKENELTRASSDLANEGSKRWFVVCYLVKWLNRRIARLSSKKSHQRSSTLVSDRSSTLPESLTASYELSRSLNRMNQAGHDLKSETSASSRQGEAARQQQPWFVRSETCVREEDEASVCNSIMVMIFYDTYPDEPSKDQPRPVNTTASFD
jgi:hypothetical protein